MEQVCKQWKNEEKRKKKETKKKKAVILKYIRQDIMMVVIYYYFEKENYKVFNFPMNNFCYFEISVTPHFEVLKLNKWHFYF